MTNLTVEQSGRPAELLLVEDNYGDVLLTQEAFRSAKIRNNLTIAVDGEEAMAVLRKQGRHVDQPTPDLILLDLNLPRMDGREVLKAIKGDAALHAIPIIVLTSSSAETDILRSYELMASGYIVKPVTFDRLKDVVGLIESFWFTVVVLPSVATVEQANAS
ncbi:MAG TPA: response regulator [Caulobacteraceae bacterium]|nr:response regulator [Caulobacteraceae bacterium]